MSILSEIRRKWKPRGSKSHKGDFGRVSIFAGSKGYTGAAYLTSCAALRSGAGLITLGVPEAIYPILARRMAEVMVRPYPATARGSFALKAVSPAITFLKTQDVLAIGPGLSKASETQAFVRKILSETKLPVVLDADGLNAFVMHSKELSSSNKINHCHPREGGDPKSGFPTKTFGNDILLKTLSPLRGRAILTPHPGEFTRLFGRQVSGRDSDRKKAASEIAKKFGIVLVLKGHRTVVANRDGQVYVNETGNPGMASGGTGDVLTGIVAALIGQKFSLWDSARFGVFIHGLAGDLAAKKIGQISLTASDILEFLPVTFLKILGR